MKIGLICPYNVAKGGAVLEIVLEMKKGYEQRGHEVRIITPLPREDGEHYDKTDMIFLGNGADFKSPLHTTAQVSVSIDMSEIDEMLERERFDILHFHEPWVPMLSRQILSRSTSVNIATFHAKIPETLMSRTVAKVVTPYTRQVLKYLHVLTAVSESAAEYVSSLTDEPITIIPNGVNLKHFAKRPLIQPYPGKKTILFVGRLERRKGIKYLLRAFADMLASYPDTHLIIGGNGPDREKLEELAEELGLTDEHVSFLGYVSDEDKIQLMQSADLFCSPAIYGESFGVVLLEALACNTVIVAGDNSGYSGVMQGIGKLSLVDPHSTEEFARRLGVLLTEEAVREDWKKWAKNYVKQFDYQAIFDQYIELYEHSLRDHSHRVRIYE